MLIVDIHQISILLVLVFAFGLTQLHNLCDSKSTRVKQHLWAYLITAVIALVSSFIAIEIGG